MVPSVLVHHPRTSMLCLILVPLTFGSPASTAPCLMLHVVRKALLFTKYSCFAWILEILFVCEVQLVLSLSVLVFF